MRKLLLFLIISGTILMTPWAIVSYNAIGHVYRDIDTVPVRTYGLLLGTTPGAAGQTNLFFTTRIVAAQELYERGKIAKILVSGDNSTRDYNEPEYMRVALMKAGVPEDDIILDYAGFRTLDSVVRAREIFGIDSFTIISQPFHIERALYIAKSNSINAIGYGAANISPRLGILPYIREIGARWLVLYDIYVGTDPVVLGEREVLEK